VGVVRPLVSADLASLMDLIEREPVRHCFVAQRVALAGVDPWRLGGDMWGYIVDGRVESAVYTGANLVPIGTSPAARAAIADRLRPGPRRCSSFVGPAEEVLDLWRLLEPAWGPAREVRASQPFLVMTTHSRVAPDPLVRPARREDIDALLPACIDMFTEEVGVSPVASGNHYAYRARVEQLIDSGRAFVRMVDGRVEFKAEVGAATPKACQLQGVWVEPRLRGTGLAEPGLAAVVALARETIAPVVSLYVNDFNTAARKAYAAVGFHEQERFATILF
jgi:predicted GNAT family acetyltransferase